MAGDNSVHIVILLVVLTIWIAPCWFVARYAARKGHPFWGFLLVGVFLSWIVELVIAFIVPDKRRAGTP